jgi:hypothetical protein
VEAFPNERSLSERMAALGFTNCICKMSLSHLRVGSAAIWSNCEIADNVFASFGELACLK